MTTRCLRALAFAAIVAGLNAAADAQWIHQPTPGIPRLADGKPNLSAPAPKAPDGKPDLSGIWYSPDFCSLFCFGKKRAAEFQPWAQEVYDQRVRTQLKDSPNARCLPPGLPNMEFDEHKIIQTQSEIAVLYSPRTMFREVFLDGRELPKDPNPSWLGYSVGHWDKDTLVIDVIGLTDRSWIGFADPHTESLKLTERYRRIDFGTMEMEITVDDPKTYVKPWMFKATLKLVPDTEIIEEVCENERDAQHMVGK